MKYDKKNQVNKKHFYPRLFVFKGVKKRKRHDLFIQYIPVYANKVFLS